MNIIKVFKKSHVLIYQNFLKYHHLLKYYKIPITEEKQVQMYVTKDWTFEYITKDTKVSNT